jgi:hypothetical protein
LRRKTEQKSKGINDTGISKRSIDDTPDEAAEQQSKQPKQPTCRIMNDACKFLKVMVGTSEVSCMLDTGASISVMSYDLFARLQGPLNLEVVTSDPGCTIVCANGG